MFLVMFSGNKASVSVPPMNTRILVPEADKTEYGL